MKAIEISFSKCNKVSKAEAKAAKSVTLNEALRIYATQGCGHIEAADLATETKAQFLRAVRVAADMQTADALKAASKSEAFAAKVEKANEAATKAANKKLQAEAAKVAADTKATEAANKAKEAKAYAADIQRQAREAEKFAKNGLTKKAEADTLAKKAEAAAKDAKAAKDAAEKASEAKAKAVATLAAAIKAEAEAEAKAATAARSAAFEALKWQGITAESASKSEAFRRFLMHCVCEYGAQIDGTLYEWREATEENEAQALTCTEFAKLKDGAKAIKAEAFPLYDRGRKFEVQDVTSVTENGRKPLRLYFREAESGRLYQVTANKSAEAAEGFEVVTKTACKRTNFAPLYMVDIMKFALSADSEAEAKAAKAEAIAAAAEARKAAEASGNAKKAAKAEALQELRNEADKLQEAETH